MTTPTGRSPTGAAAQSPAHGPRDPQQLKLLQQGIDGDDERAEADEDSVEREDELRQQVARLEKALQKSEDWLHFSSDLFRDALNTSLRVSAQGSGVGSESVPQLKPRDPVAVQADPERAEWIFPAADELPGGEQSWGDVLDALRRPRRPGEKLWEWRRNTAPQPVVFKDPKEVNADRVHLHLEHPLVQRLLNRFLVRGFQGEELSRAAVIATHDDTAKLILLARMSLYGHRYSTPPRPTWPWPTWKPACVSACRQWRRASSASCEPSCRRMWPYSRTDWKPSLQNGLSGPGPAGQARRRRGQRLREGAAGAAGADPQNPHQARQRV
jgi:hypothetical protein